MSLMARRRRRTAARSTAPIGGDAVEASQEAPQVGGTGGAPLALDVTDTSIPHAVQYGAGGVRTVPLVGHTDQHSLSAPRGTRWPWLPIPMRLRRGDQRSTPEGAVLGELADQVAPPSAELHADYVRLGDELASVIPITSYPRHVAPGWFGRFADFDIPGMEISLHIRPRNSQTLMRALRRRLTEFDASRRLDLRQGRLIDREREVATQDVAALLERLERGEDRVCETAIYVLARSAARSFRTLTQRIAQIQSALNTQGFGGGPATFEQDLAFRSCLPTSRDELRRTRQLDASSLAMAFPFTSASLSMPDGLLYGVVPSNGSLVILDPFSPQLENANMAVFAKSGAGKSFLCKVLALRALLTGTAVCVVDPEPLEEYRPLCEAVRGQYVRLAPGAAQHLNPFDLAPDDLAPAALLLDSPTPPPLGSRRARGESDSARGSARCGELRDQREGSLHADRRDDPLADKIQSLLAFLDLLLAESPGGEAGRLTQREKGLLDQALTLTYAQAGITRDPATHQQPPPLLADLYAVLRTADFGAGSVDLAASLAGRMARFVEGSLAGLFNAQTNVQLDNPLVVFSIRELDADLRALGLWLITDFVWTRMRRERGRQPRLLFIDEAWSLIQHAEGGQFLASLARRARKYYLGLITITQDAADFLANDYGRTVLSQAAIQLLLLQSSSTIDAVAATFALSEGERSFLLSCPKGHGLIFARNTHAALHVVASPFEYQLATTNPRELAARRARPPAANSLTRPARAGMTTPRATGTSRRAKNTPSPPPG